MACFSDDFGLKDRRSFRIHFTRKVLPTSYRTMHLYRTAWLGLEYQTLPRQFELADITDPGGVPCIGQLLLPQYPRSKGLANPRPNNRNRDSLQCESPTLRRAR